MKPAIVLILGRTGKGSLEELGFALGLTVVVRERMQDALSKLRHEGLAAVLVDRKHVNIDVLEFILNVRDIDDHVPVFVVGRSHENGTDKVLLSLRRTFLLDGPDVQDRLAEELGKALTTDNGGT